MDAAADTILSLSIESSNPSALEDGVNGPGVALARILRTAGRFEVSGTILTEPLRRETGRDDDLLPAIDRLFRNAGARPEQLGLVSVSAGPGGFTALRVAVTAAKMLAYSTDAMCASVPSAWVAAHMVKSSGRFAVLLAGKNDSAFATLFEAGWERRLGDQAPATKLVRAEDVAGLNVGLIVADKYLPEAIRAAAAALHIPVEHPRFRAASCLELGCLIVPGGPESLNPIYPREPEAVTQWKARNQK
ncbi:MAG: tRNA (adenosine(37)-N6)-threonylcarbamoyltransferase complex dimerization subunit type 1 TsaB [Phycisphaeraceae bacterium]|nr:tRNA (adenosine(37)-N6)-threonylcarbamoyltransferase complex dimerization subunit type 1 TsaB [Phycisphaeraceae bacterium]